MDREKQIQKMLKALPAKATRHGNQLGWDKRGGYAGERQIAKALLKMLAMGFRKEDNHSSGSPDGNVTSSGVIYVNDQGDRLRTNSRYGVTASDNSFSISITLAEGKLEKDIVQYVNEGARRDALPPPSEKDGSGLAYPRGRHVDGGLKAIHRNDKLEQRRGKAT